MGSFSCPHFDIALDYCMLIERDCVPGRAGCVLRSTSTFLIPAEERIRSKLSAGESERNEKSNVNQK